PSRGAPRGALEGHVLQQVRNAVLFLALVAAAATDPHPERRGLQMRHGIGDHDQAGGKARQLHTHAAAPWAARLAPRMKCSTAFWSAGSTCSRSGGPAQSARP